MESREIGWSQCPWKSWDEGTWEGVEGGRERGARCNSIFIKIAPKIKNKRGLKKPIMIDSS